MDVGDGCAMDELRRAMCQCRGSFVGKHRTGTLQVDVLFHTLTGSVAEIVHRQVRFDQRERMRTEAFALRIGEHGRVRPILRAKYGDLEKLDATEEVELPQVAPKLL